jgi:hypothetical protein
MTNASKGGTDKSDVYVDEPWLLMRWDATNACVFSEWKGFANTTEFRAGVLKGVQAVRDHRATGYVTDTRKVRVIVHEDQKWANEVVAPMLVQAGLKRLGVVIADAGLGRMTVEETVRMADTSALLVRTFNTVSEAMKWAGGG